MSVWGLGIRVMGMVSRANGLQFRVKNFRVNGSRFRVFGFWVQGKELRA